MKTDRIGRWMMVGSLLLGLSAQAQTVPGIINYQGKLMDGTNLFNGLVEMSFQLYDAETGGVLHYEDSNTVAVVDGLYSTFIGDNDVWGQLDNALYQEEVWIEVVIDGQIIEPRERLASVGYARFANRLPANAVDMGMIAPNAVQNWHIGNNQVRVHHIQNASVTSNKIDWSTMPTLGLKGYAENGTFATAPVASGNNSIAMGFGASAGSEHSVVGGGNNNVIGNNSVQAVIGGGGHNRIGDLSRYTTIAGGFQNAIGDSSANAAIAGGRDNRVDSNGGFIGGGLGNIIGTNSTRAVVGGGDENQVAHSSPNAGILGGSGNVIGPSAGGAVIGGGRENTASGKESTIGGGVGNTASATNAVIGGGIHNIVAEAAEYAVVAGGQSNEVRGAHGAISGGRLNLIQIATNSVIAGGFENRIEPEPYGPQRSPCFSVIGGGSSNVVPGAKHATISGGRRCSASGNDATIGGGHRNSISINGEAATIGGGYYNQANRPYSTVGGGENNVASGDHSTVGGGKNNTISSGAPYGTVAGGSYNAVRADYGTVGGGLSNVVSNAYATVAGGLGNHAVADYAMIPGGRQNRAVGYSFAAGRRAKANYSGSFVWGDNQDADIVATRQNQFLVRCVGGAQFTSGQSGDYHTIWWAPGTPGWGLLCDRNRKENMTPVDTAVVLQKVAALPITEWNYKGYTQRNIGPMAQDFHAAFPLEGSSEYGIDSYHLDGVALAAIQGLNAKVEALKAENAQLQTRLDRLEALLGAQAL